MKLVKWLIALVLAWILAGCSSEWNAAIEYKPLAGTPARSLTVRLRSELGDEFESRLDHGCVNVRLPQSPKRPNRVAIDIFDADGKLLGHAQTHDLANQKIELPLNDESGVIIVRASGQCA